MKNILITGINGFLGSNLAKTLSRNYSIIGIEKSFNNLSRIDGRGYNLYKSQKNALQNIFKEYKIDIVIHAATVYGNSNESVDKLIEANVLLPVRLYELAQKNGTEVFLNTDSFYNNPKYHYDYLQGYVYSKKICLEWLRNMQRNTKLINMKLYHMYGPGDSPRKFVTQIVTDLKCSKPEIHLTAGEQMRDFIYIDDVVQAYKTVINNLDKIDKPFLDIDVGTGKATTLKQFVKTARQVTKSKSKLIFGTLKYREGEIMFSEADNSILTSLGWKPRYKLKKGLSESIK